ncbi:MAG TPA: zinc ribbon domain-containing protein [Rhizomicrobium sp.]
MPIYEYHCGRCRKRFSVLTLRVSEVVEPICPTCGTRSEARVPSRFATTRRSDGDDFGDLDGGDDLGDMGDMGDDAGGGDADDF